MVITAIETETAISYTVNPIKPLHNVHLNYLSYFEQVEILRNFIPNGIWMVIW